MDSINFSKKALKRQRNRNYFTVFYPIVLYSMLLVSWYEEKDGILFKLMLVVIFAMIIIDIFTMYKVIKNRYIDYIAIYDNSIIIRNLAFEKSIITIQLKIKIFYDVFMLREIIKS